MNRTQSPDRQLSICNRKSFTLIELLVVVAIIAVLVTVLLPSLAAARALGKQATCTANEHQLGLATQMYMSDYQAYYPPHESWGGLTVPMWDYLPPLNSNRSDAMRKYSFSRTWICPLLPRNNPYYPSPAYAANSVFSTSGRFWGPGRWAKEGDIPNPSRTMWLTEGLYFGPNGTYINSYPQDYIFWYEVPNVTPGWVQHCYPDGVCTVHHVSHRHNLQAVALFADMHVQPMPYNELQDYGWWQW